jgi:membrane-bound metal-dependent hydrolase YbcI (DUF457 family)
MLTTLHFLTHIGQSWIIAHLRDGSARDRWLIVLAGIVLDLDGAGIVWSQQAYIATHRVVGHGLLAALVVLVLVMVLADAPWPTGILAACAFHLHVLLDVVGTGGFPIPYVWPFARWELAYGGHWVLASWPNVAVMILTLLGVLAIAWRRATARWRGW